MSKTKNVMILGASAVGKTCIFYRATKPGWTFTEDMHATIAVTKPVVKTMEMDDCTTFPLKLWDCGGQERFKTISKAFLKDASGVLIIYSPDQDNSIQTAKMWIDSVNELRLDGKSIEIALACNKVDLPESMWAIKDWKEQCEAMSKEYTTDESPCPFFAISAKTQQGVPDMFMAIAKKVRAAASGGGKKVEEDTAGGSAEGGCCIVQ